MSVAMERVRVSLLGGLSMHHQGVAVERFPTRKVALLLAALAMDHPRPVSREALATVLWPDALDTQARQNLRQAVVMLRRTLEAQGWDPQILSSDRNRLWLNAEVETDASSLEAAMSRSSGRGLESLLSNLLEYRTFMPDHYEEWVIEHRRRLDALFVACAVDTTCQLLSRGRCAEALDLSRRALEIDDLCEAAHASVVRSLAAQSRHSEAQVHVETMRRRLQEALGVEPSVETMAAVRLALASQVERTDAVEELTRQIKDGTGSERAAACAQLMERAFQAWYGGEESEWLERVAGLEPEIFGVLQWCEENDPATGLSIAGAMGRFWLTSRNFARGKAALQRALTAKDRAENRHVARALVSLFVMSLMSGQPNLEEMDSMLDEAERRYRTAGDTWGVAHATRNRGLLRNYQRRLTEARQCFDHALRLFGEVKDPSGVALTILCTGIMRKGDNNEAGLDELEQAYLQFHEIGNEWGRGLALMRLSANLIDFGPEALRRTIPLLELELRRHTAWTDRPKICGILSRIALSQYILGELPACFATLVQLAQHAQGHTLGQILTLAEGVRTAISEEHLAEDENLSFHIELHEEWERDNFGETFPRRAMSADETTALLSSLPLNF
jgi:DNA-binding SARP family transcriptional activator